VTGGHESWTAKGGNVNSVKTMNYHKETHRRRLVRRGRVGVHHGGAAAAQLESKHYFVLDSGNCND
jgi:hypothetical protein